MKSTHLIQRKTGRIYPYSDNLSKRADMLPCDKSGKINGSASVGDEPQKVIESMEDENRGLREIIDVKNAEIVALKARIEKLQAELVGSPPDAKEEEVITEGASGREASLDEIVEAISLLDKDKGHFTKAGVPRVEALEEVLDAAVTMEQRDQAWAEYQAKAE